MGFLKNGLRLVVGSFIVLLFSLLFPIKTTQILADDNQNAINSAPPGLDISKYFVLPTNPTVYGDNNPYKTNSATTYRNNTILGLTNGDGTYGVSWSNQSNDNYFNINQTETISAWLYFGANSNFASLNGQGMAFVLQNDPRKTNAIGAGDQGLGVYGYDKSTYLPLFYSNLPTTDYIASTAVQNSMALEFDSLTNDVTSENSPLPLQKSNRLGSNDYTLNGYDTVDTTGKITAPDGYPKDTKLGAAGPFGHIALTYPGKKESYALGRVGSQNLSSDILSLLINNFKGFDQAYSVFHSGTKVSDLVDGTDLQNNPLYWHHVTITWHKSTDGGKTNQLEYQINDKYLDGTLNANTNNSDYEYLDKTFTVDPKVLNAGSDGKVYWGFTGSNTATASLPSNLQDSNSTTYNKLVVFESIPALVTVTPSTTITDHNLNKVIYDDSTSDVETVNNGDDLTLDYNLDVDREASRKNWTNVVAKMNLPTNINYKADTNGNIATITYTNTLTNKTSTDYISGSQLTAQQLNFTLSKALGAQSGADFDKVKISINGQANNPTTSDLKVGPAPSVFTGNEAIVSTSSPKFIIKGKKDYTLQLANPSGDIDLYYKKANTDLTLPTQLKYSNGNTFDQNSSMDYTVTVNGHTYHTVETGANLSSDLKTYNGSVPLKSLIAADSTVNDFWDLFPANTTQKVTVTAYDRETGLVSNSVTYNVNIHEDHLLSMTVTKNLTFQSTNTFSTSRILKRKTNFDLSISSRQDPWKLSVSSNGLAQGGQAFNGNVVYKYSEASNSQDLTSSPTLIESDPTISDNLIETDISKNWTDNSGLLLKQTGSNTSGTYTGTLTWTLTSSLGSNS